MKKRKLMKTLPTYACIAATLTSMVGQSVMMPVTVHAATDGNSVEADQTSTGIEFAEESSVTVDVGNLYQTFAEDSGIVSLMDEGRSARIIKITKDGTYTFTGSNYINESYVDTKIYIAPGVTANIICDHLEIKNDYFYYVSQTEAPEETGVPAAASMASEVDCTDLITQIATETDLTDASEETFQEENYYTPIYVEEGSVLNLAGTGSFCGATDYWGDKCSSVWGGGKLDIYEGTFEFGSDCGVNELVIRTGNICGEGELYVLGDGIISDTNGNALSKYTFVTARKDTVVDEIFYDMGEECQYMATEYTATDAEGNLNLYLSDQTERVELVMDGGMIYAYEWSDEAQKYVETAPKHTEACTVTYVEEDGTELCHQYCTKGGSVVLPTFAERDVVFLQGDSAFDGTMVVKNETVTVKDTVLELNVTIDGEAFVYEKGVTKLPANRYYVDEANGVCYKGGDTVKTACTLKSIGYTPVEEAEVLQIASDENMEAYAVLSQFEVAKRMDVELLSDVSLNQMLFAGENMSFEGTFDGNGHTVTVTYDRKEDDAALFRKLQGTVKILL